MRKCRLLHLSVDTVILKCILIKLHLNVYQVTLNPLAAEFFDNMHWAWRKFFIYLHLSRNFFSQLLTYFLYSHFTMSVLVIWDLHMVWVELEQFCKKAILLRIEFWTRWCYFKNNIQCFFQTSSMVSVELSYGIYFNCFL